MQHRPPRAACRGWAGSPRAHALRSPAAARPPPPRAQAHSPYLRATLYLDAAQMDQASLIGRRAFVDMAAKCNFPDPLSASVSRHCAQRANRSASACKRLTGHAAAAKRAATAKQASIGSR